MSRCGMLWVAIIVITSPSVIPNDLTKFPRVQGARHCVRADVQEEALFVPDAELSGVVVRRTREHQDLAARAAPQALTTLDHSVHTRVRNELAVGGGPYDLDHRGPHRCCDHKHFVLPSVVIRIRP